MWLGFRGASHDFDAAAADAQQLEFAIGLQGSSELDWNRPFRKSAAVISGAL